MTILSVSMLASTSVVAYEDEEQEEPVTLLVDFKIANSDVGTTADGIQYYVVGGPGYAPKEIQHNGEITNKIEGGRQIARLEGARVTFTGEPNDPIIEFTCLSDSCRMTFKDGSILVSNAGVDLESRTVNKWGPVHKSRSFDPVNGIIPIRIMGCGGLKEIAGKGRLANMVGSICLNGVFNYNINDHAKLTGSSKCTITMHTPLDSISIP